MDPNTLTVSQLKKALRQRQLSEKGRKAKLIARMDEADPTGEWISEAYQYYGDDDLDEINPTGTGGAEDDMIRRNRLDAELQRREMELMRREMELLRRENDLLRVSSCSVSTTLQATVSIKSIGELLSEYQDSGEDFEQ